MRHLLFVLAMCAAVALLAGSVMAQGTVVPSISTSLTTVQGIISAVDLDKGSITIVPPTMPGAPPPTTSFTFFVNAQTIIKKNDQLTTLSNLAKGDICAATVKMTLTGALATGVYTKTPPPPSTVLMGGVISAIDLDKSTITLSPPPSTTSTPPPPVTFLVVSTTKIYKNGQQATLKDLLVNDQAVIEATKAADGTLTAVSIQAKSPMAPPPPPTTRIVEGIISTIDPAARTFSLSVKPGPMAAVVVLNFIATADAKIRKDGTVVSFGDLKRGDLAAVAYLVVPTMTPTTVLKAIAIDARTAPAPPPVRVTLAGTISAVDLDKRTVTLTFPAPPAGSTAPTPAPVTVLVVDATKICKNGQPATLKDLAVNDLAQIEATKTADGPLTALSIQAKSPVPPPPTTKTVAGVISAIDPAARTFSLTVKLCATSAPTVLNFVATNDARIRKDGVAATFADLKAGDFAAVVFVVTPTMTPTTTLQAISIEAKSAPTAPPPPTINVQ